MVCRPKELYSPGTVAAGAKCHKLPKTAVSLKSQKQRAEMSKHNFCWWKGRALTSTPFRTWYRVCPRRISSSWWQQKPAHASPIPSQSTVGMMEKKKDKVFSLLSQFSVWMIQQPLSNNNIS
ncbi:hypothetical protein EK904_009699 [Melospiza melodia maxima]|nr:hypothetical protein EK904_009699 [Melospiza melodia maxima]